MAHEIKSEASSCQGKCQYLAREMHSHLPQGTRQAVTAVATCKQARRGSAQNTYKEGLEVLLNHTVEWDLDTCHEPCHPTLRSESHHEAGFRDSFSTISRYLSYIMSGLYDCIPICIHCAPQRKGTQALYSCFI